MPIPSVPLSGNLKAVSISAVLHLLKTSTKTGILTVRQNSFTKTVHFQNGAILFSASNHPNDSLVEMLLKSGQINFQEYEQAKSLLKSSGKMEGAVLMEQGFIKPKTFFDALTVQMKEIVVSLFLWEDAAYSFRESGIPLEGAIGISIDPDQIIHDGWFRISDLTRLNQFLPPLSSVLKKNAGQTISSLGGGAQLDEVWNLINDEQTIRDLLVGFATQTVPMLQALNILIGTERVIAAIPRAKTEPVDTKEGEKAEMKEEDPWNHEPIEIQIKKILEIHESLPLQNYYEILNVPPRAEKKEIKQAYFKLAKRYHPDRYLSQGVSDEAKKIGAVFSQLTHAYDTLSHDPLRKEYDKTLESASLKATVKASPLQEALSRAEAALFQNDLKNGLYFLEEVIRIMPESIEKSAVYFRYGQVLAMVPGKLKEAVEALQKSAGLDFSKGAPHFALGKIYMKTELIQKAEAAFHDVIKRDPENKAAREALATINLKKEKST
ncbi:MAG: DUF4388 domain-containing protein [Nitrospirota bacterium]